MMKKYINIILAILLATPVMADVKISLIPEPKEIIVHEGAFILSSVTKLQLGDKALAKNIEFLNEYISWKFGFTLKAGSSGNNIIRLQQNKKMPVEAYQLVVDNKGITIRGGEAGVFYAIQTLQQLMVTDNNGNINIPYVTINDEPRFEYRGLMLDVGRYFYPVEFIKRYIDLMSHYKINRFHWHLTEDAGWRIEIKSHPELTRIGSWRNSTQYGRNPGDHDRIPHGGYYTQEQVKDIIKYAADRHITIVPEVDMPAHTLSILAAYPELSCTGGPFVVQETWGAKEDVLCLGNDATYRLVEDILTELIELFPGDLIHIGGDEARKNRWKECPKCQERIKQENLKDEHELQSYFIHHLDKFVTSKGKSIVGWDEILEGGLAPNAVVMSWRGEAGGIKAASQKHRVIMAPNNYMYIDYYQSTDHIQEPYSIGRLITLEHIYSYEPYTPKLTFEQHKYIIGVQANLWCEFIHHPNKVEYMAYPRSIALSEIGWSSADKKDYNSFMERLPLRLADLDRRGITFRIPEPIGYNKAKVIDGVAVIELKPSVAGADIYYTTDGSNPHIHGKKYVDTIHVPLSYTGVNVKCYLRLPSGRFSAVYTILN